MSVSLKNLKLLADFISKNEYEGSEEASYYFQAEHDVIYTNLTLDKYPEESEDGKYLESLGISADYAAEVWVIYT